MTVSEILAVLNECNFEELSSENVNDKVIAAIEQELDQDVSFDTGATKVVIFFPNTDFVVKIPLGGYEVPEEEYDEEYNEYFETGDYSFSSFQFADDGETGDDYCKVEMIRYQNAIDYDDGVGKIAKLFAPTSFIGYVHEYPIYAQPLCEVFSNRHNKNRVNQETMDSTIETCEEKKYYCFNATWLSEVIACYGEDTFNLLCQFIQEEGIDDLHDNNIGYLNGKPILFDYSGYNE